MTYFKSGIGIVIPTYNNELTIARCLQSVARQTLQPDQVILTDDASSDRTLDVVSKLEGLGMQIQVVTKKTNVGLGKNVVDAVELLTTEYFTKLDGDDVYLNPKKLEHELKLCSAGEGKVIAYSITPRIDELNRVLYLPDVARHRPEPESILYRTIEHMPREMLIPLSALRLAGGYPTEPKLYVDWWLKAALASRFAFECTGEIGAGYRIKHLNRVQKMSSQPPIIHYYWVTRGFLKNYREFHGKLNSKDCSFLFRGFFSTILGYIKRYLKRGVYHPLQRIRKRVGGFLDGAGVSK